MIKGNSAVQYCRAKLSFSLNAYIFQVTSKELSSWKHHITCNRQ